jgi:NTP pyrophosphatase (non-canonical NTP hydrolase)
VSLGDAIYGGTTRANQPCAGKRGPCNGPIRTVRTREWGALSVCIAHERPLRDAGEIVDRPATIRLILETPMPLVVRPFPIPGQCRIDGCITPVRARGLCATHHSAASHAGRLEELAAPSKNGGPRSTYIERVAADHAPVVEVLPVEVLPVVEQLPPALPDQDCDGAVEEGLGEPCEGCKSPAVTRDVDSVPLCGPCYDALPLVDTHRAAVEPLRLTDVRSEVLSLALAMERKLRANDAKKGPRGWKDHEPMRLLARVRQETKEVERALTNIVDPSEVLDECADVANMVMMVADAAGALPPYTAPHPADHVVGVLRDLAERTVDIEADPVVVALRARVAELEATIAAERGDPTGALPGWEWAANSWRSGDQIVIRVTFGAWDVLVRVPGAPVEILRVVTAREGMRLANERVDAARAVAK